MGGFLFVKHTLLAIILNGDDVEDVFSNIYTYLHEDSSILSGKTYKEIGDCKVLFDKDASWVNPSNNSASFVFRILLFVFCLQIQY